MASSTLAPVSVLFLWMLSGGVGLPVAMPPLEPDPLIARAAPEECLWYLSWAGTAEPDATSSNQTEQLLAEEEVRHFVEKINSELTAAVGRNAQGDAGQLLATEGPSLARVLLTRPAAIYVSHFDMRPDRVDLRAALVVNTGDQAEAVRNSLDKIEAFVEAHRGDGKKADDVTLAGTEMRRIPLVPPAPDLYWGFKNEYLLVASGEQAAEQLVARLDEAGSPAPWLDELNERLPVDRPGVVSYLNVSAVLERFGPLIPGPQAPAVIDALGLNDIQWFGSVSGLDEQGMVTKSFVAIEGEPRGLLALVPAEGLSADDLRPIPANVTFASAWRLDLASVWQQILDTTGRIDPAAREDAARDVARLEEDLGIRLAEDLLEPLGDVWCLYNAPAEGGAMLTGMAATVDVRDHQRLEETLGKLVERARTELERQAVSGRAGPERVVIKDFDFNGHKVYYVQWAIPIAPAWCLTQDRLVLALYPQMIKAHLSRDARAPSLADVDAVAAVLEEQGVSAVSYQDTGAVMELVYPFLQMLTPPAAAGLQSAGFDFQIPSLPSLASIRPHLLPAVGTIRRTEQGILVERHQTLPLVSSQLSAAGPVAVALLLPAVQAAREAARRSQSSNNLKQIGIAMHSFHDVYKRFPNSTYDAGGKPMLSWRVHILPFVEERPLYEQFRLDEPWDSEHNLKLAEQVPPVYQAPGWEQLARESKTLYLAASGKAALFQPRRQGPRLADITDGTSNTIIVVEADPERAVVWTKPDDLEIDPKQPLAGWGNLRPQGAQALFCDGSVRMIPKTIDPEMLRRLFDPHDGQPVGDF